MLRRPVPVPALARISIACSLLLALGASTGCLARRAVVVEELLEPLGHESSRVPTSADLAAARLARIALVDSATSSSRVQTAYGALEKAPKTRSEERLGDLARDLANASLDDPLAELAATRRLRRTIGLDPRLAMRLDERLAEDPLAQARLRNLDDWQRLFARTFNSVAQPLGQTAITGFLLAPYTLANSFLHYFAEFSNAEPLSTTDRQALVLRESFLAAHPKSGIAPKVERRVARDRVRLAKTLARRRIRASEQALEAGSPELARHHARAAETLVAPHPDALRRLRRKADALDEMASRTLDEDARLDARSLEARASAPGVRENERELAALLLARPLDPGTLGSALARYEAAAGRAGRGRSEFLRALARQETGHVEGARRTLAQLAGAAVASDPMTRHAKQLVEDEWQNAWDAYLRLRRQARRVELAHRLAGEWINRPRYPNLWPPIAYLIDTPTIAMTITLAPVRALFNAFSVPPDYQRATALAGYRYLQRHPEGEHQREVLDWLYAYERRQNRPARALRLADMIPEFPSEKRRELVDEAAGQELRQLDRLERRDQRVSVLRGVVTEFPDSDGGQEAGRKAREEAKDASAQRIRITRGFLLENPAVAGHTGLGLSPLLLDGDPTNGELHPNGVVLRGGRVLEILLRDENRDEDAKPVSRVRRISKQRLVRLTAALDEAVRRNSLVDAGARFAPDANREAYLERARLGLVEDLDARAAGESRFVYQSLRERYGAVRGRDSLLPFDIVFRGSLGDFSLGAFPRWRMPLETDDAFLYR